MGRFGRHICSTMKILRERIVVHILKSVVSTIRNLDSKQNKCHLERFGGHNFLTIRIILWISCTYTTCKTCRFGKISRVEKQQTFLQIQNKKKCHFGVICFNHEKVVFGSSKSKNLPKLTHFHTFSYGNNHELYVESVLSKKIFSASRRTRKKRQEYCHSRRRRFQHFYICRFGEISGQK